MFFKPLLFCVFLGIVFLICFALLASSGDSQNVPKLVKIGFGGPRFAGPVFCSHFGWIFVYFGRARYVKIVLPLKE